MYQPNEHALELGRGVLLEIQAGLEAMHGKPRRVAYRDFSLWPSGPGFRNDAEDKAFEDNRRRQIDGMWDRTTP